jgi:hypothetical protein
MFEPRAALDACRSAFIAAGVNLDVLRLGPTIAAFFNFYRDDRATGCDPGDEADRLLFEWGTVDWGDGEHFEMSLSRQLTYGDDAKTWQLKLTYAFQPTEEFRALGSENRWCESPEALDAFCQAVEGSKAYETANAHGEIGIVSIGYYRAG